MKPKKKGIKCNKQLLPAKHSGDYTAKNIFFFFNSKAFNGLENARFQPFSSLKHNRNWNFNTALLELLTFGGNIIPNPHGSFKLYKI